MTLIKHHSLTDPIIFTAARLETIANRFVFEPLGLTLSSARIIRLLADNGKLTPGDLLKYSGGTKGNVSQRLKFLEREGYIQRVNATGASDKRTVVVELTTKGQKQFEQIFQRFEKARQCLESSFSSEEKQSYYAFFAKLNQMLDQSEQEFPKIFTR